MYYHVWAEINLDALKFNTEQILKLIPAEKIIAVVKANAYGHGAKMVAKELYNMGIKRFAVSNVYEALDLRFAKTKGEILLFGNTDVNSVLDLARNDITACIYDLECAKRLSKAATDAGVTLKCHIKLDTGMGRLGFDCRQGSDTKTLRENIKKVFALRGLNITGGFTHFATADRDNDEGAVFKKQQYALFTSASEILRQIAADCGKGELELHCSNSAATLLDSVSEPSDLYRAGIILYGLTPSKDLNLPIPLKPIMTVKAKVTQVKNIKRGDSISYGKTFTAKKDMKIATISIGYADGYMRGLSGKGQMLIGNTLAPIVGRVCMDQTMLDVTDLDGVQSGDTVTVFGEGLPVEKLSTELGTINYELVCAVAHRIPRVYIKGGKQIKVIRYRSI